MFGHAARLTAGLIVGLAASLTIPALATEDPPRQAEQPLDFNRDIRPILSDKCFACHGPDEAHRGAMLRLDVRQDALDHGAIVPRHPQESPLVQRITSTQDDERMPPPKSGKTLTPAEARTLTRWIEQGAPYADHWAFVPPRRHAFPATRGVAPSWIDAFLLARLEREGLTLAPTAERRTLARRLAWDLTGLPLPPDAVDEFVADRDPLAYERLVDRLLASEAFGERLAMYWLDLVRFADTVGYHGDQDHHASPYRDYVIDAFNQNLPFDRFTHEQLAGDLLASATDEQRIASCYNRLLQTSHEGGVQPREYLAMYAADRVRNVATVWMGATLGCAQCHDHKYDPYTSRDFYAFAAFFADIDEERHLRGEGGDTLPTRRAPEIDVVVRRTRLQLESLDAALTALGPLETPPQQAAARPLLEASERARGQKRRVMITQALPTPRVTRVLPRGNWLDESGEVVEPAVPAFLGKIDRPDRASRLDLARWLTDVESGAGGQTARVFVNRLWSLFFGAGLSRSLDDFGGQGNPPDHPELLDTLAVEFIDSGWDVKQLVRLMVLSHAYRQSSRESPEALARDPENRLLSRQARWRLPAESVRDSALAASGLLVSTVGGPSVRPYQPAGYYRHLNFPKREYSPDMHAGQWRRGLYVHWQRQFLHPMLKAFDAPSREECTAQRARSNTPLAALVLLNDPTFLECARALAAEALRQPIPEDAARLRFAFRQVTAREPDADELRLLLELLRENLQDFHDRSTEATQLLGVGAAPRDAALKPAEWAAWTATCRAVLNLSEGIMRE